MSSELSPANEYYFGLVIIVPIIMSSPLSFQKKSWSRIYNYSKKCSGEFWEHLLFKLGAASALLLQAFQGKGAVNGATCNCSDGGEISHL